MRGRQIRRPRRPRRPRRKRPADRRRTGGRATSSRAAQPVRRRPRWVPSASGTRRRVPSSGAQPRAVQADGPSAVGRAMPTLTRPSRVTPASTPVRTSRRRPGARRRHRPGAGPGRPPAWPEPTAPQAPAGPAARTVQRCGDFRALCGRYRCRRAVGEEGTSGCRTAWRPSVGRWHPGSPHARCRPTRSRPAPTRPPRRSSTPRPCSRPHPRQGRRRRRRPRGRRQGPGRSRGRRAHRLPGRSAAWIPAGRTTCARSPEAIDRRTPNAAPPQRPTRRSPQPGRCRPPSSRPRHRLRPSPRRRRPGGWVSNRRPVVRRRCRASAAHWRCSGAPTRSRVIRGSASS